MKRITAFLFLAILITAVLASCSAAFAQAGPPPPPPSRSESVWVYGTNNTWNASWNRRPNPRKGACFYTGAGFTGNHFCVLAGDKLPSLPGDFGDNISSIQTFGGAAVKIFNDRNFQGGSTMVRHSASDLRQLPFRDGHTWNNRVSSMIVY